jgi:hypothetical protein
MLRPRWVTFGGLRREELRQDCMLFVLSAAKRLAQLLDRGLQLRRGWVGDGLSKFKYQKLHFPLLIRSLIGTSKQFGLQSSP